MEAGLADLRAQSARRLVAAALGRAGGCAGVVAAIAAAGAADETLRAQLLEALHGRCLKRT